MASLCQQPLASMSLGITQNSNDRKQILTTILNGQKRHCLNIKMAEQHLQVNCCQNLTTDTNASCRCEPFLFLLKADFARYRVTNGFFLVRVWASSRVLWAKRRVLISVSLGRAAPSERNDWISICAPFLLMSPGVNQPAAPASVCVCVVRRCPAWPVHTPEL